MAQSTKQVKVIPQATPTPGQGFETTAFFDAAGAPLAVGTAGKTQIAALTGIATADATDAATAVTLANATKAKVNQIINALKA